MLQGAEEDCRVTRERAEALRSGRIDPRDDNMLLVTTDGRKAALDAGLHQSELPDHPTSKVNLAVREVFQYGRKQRTNASPTCVLRFVRADQWNGFRSMRTSGQIAWIAAGFRREMAFHSRPR